MSMTICHIIGVLDDGINSLNAEALHLLHSADHVIAGSRLLEVFAAEILQAKQYDLTHLLKQVPQWINTALTADESVVVLASGDPLCYGIGSFLTQHIARNRLRILPNLSNIQLAFAELMLPWQNAKIVSIHSHDSGEWQYGATSKHGLYKLAMYCRQHLLLAILTSPENTPSRIARLLEIENLADDFEIAIAQNQKQLTQKTTDFLPVSLVSKTLYSQPNVVILKRKTPLQNPVLFGQSDSYFQQRRPEKGLITKCEVRAVSLARMQLTRSSIVWDIGAGSGAVGLEAANLCSEGHVFAIEKNSEDIVNIQYNHRVWNVSNYSLFHGKAPQFLEDWQTPDAIFIGGSGGELATLISLCVERLNFNGWLVMNFVTFENLTTAVETLKKIGANWDVIQIQASRSRPILHMNRLQAENPVWIVSATVSKNTENS